MSTCPPWLEARRREHGLGAVIDHTLFRAETRLSEITRLCDEAVGLGLGQVCVNGQWVAAAVQRLARAPVRVVTVVGFPLGASGAAAKAAEARLAVGEGAHEVDMVMALGSAKAGRWDEVGDEITRVVGAADGRLVRVIVESAALTPEEISRAARTAVAAGAGSVKTSTGFHAAGGASVEAVRLLREAVGLDTGVKASGGIRTAQQALGLLRAGADRIGTSGAAGWTAVLGGAAPSLEDLLAGG